MIRALAPVQLTELPEEVILVILSSLEIEGSSVTDQKSTCANLDDVDVLKISQTCKYFHNFGLDHTLWKNLNARIFNLRYFDLLSWCSLDDRALAMHMKKGAKFIGFSINHQSEVSDDVNVVCLVLCTYAIIIIFQSSPFAVTMDDQILKMEWSFQARTKYTIEHLASDAFLLEEHEAEEGEELIMIPGTYRGKTFCGHTRIARWTGISGEYVDLFEVCGLLAGGGARHF